MLLNAGILLKLSNLRNILAGNKVISSISEVFFIHTYKTWLLISRLKYILSTDTLISQLQYNYFACVKGQNMSLPQNMPQNMPILQHFLIRLNFELLNPQNFGQSGQNVIFFAHHAGLTFLPAKINKNQPVV